MSASPSLARKKKKSGSKIGFLYLLPALIAYGYVVIVPTFQSLWFSFFKWNGITEAQWVGLNNYIGFLSNPLIKQAFSHTLVLILFYSYFTDFPGPSICGSDFQDTD